jgi:hypothetical protein
MNDFNNGSTDQRIHCARCGDFSGLRLIPAKPPHWGRVNCIPCGDKYVKFTYAAEADRNGLVMDDGGAV